MRYMCLVYVDPALASAASPERWRQIQSACLAFNEDLRRSGHYIASNALAESNTATTLRKRSGKVIVIDGPFAETKEVLGGFFLIEASDRDEALAIAGRSPLASMGSIEIRETAGF